MKRILPLLGLGLAAMLVGFTWTSTAQDEKPAAPDDVFQKRGMFHQRLKDDLKITDEQLQQLEKIRTEGRKEVIELKSKLQITQMELAELMEKKGNDEAVLAKAKEISALRATMAELATKHQLARRAIFTDEQWQKIAKIKKFAKQRTGMRQRMMRQRSHRGPSRFHQQRRFRSGRRTGPHMRDRF